MTLLFKNKKTKKNYICGDLNEIVLKKHLNQQKNVQFFFAFLP